MWAPDGTLRIETPDDVVSVRQSVRQRAVEMGFNLVEQTKIVTAASELARNTLQLGGGGTCPGEGTRVSIIRWR